MDGSFREWTFRHGTLTQGALEDEEGVKRRELDLELLLGMDWEQCGLGFEVVAVPGSEPGANTTKFLFGTESKVFTETSFRPRLD